MLFDFVLRFGKSKIKMVAVKLGEKFKVFLKDVISFPRIKSHNYVTDYEEGYYQNAII